MYLIEDGGAKKLEEMTPKDRKKHRRMQKNNYEKISRMKNMWEQVRRLTCFIIS